MRNHPNIDVSLFVDTSCRIKSSIVHVLTVSSLFLSANCALAQPLPANADKISQENWKTASAQIIALRDTEPEKAIALCRDFILTNPEMGSTVGMDVYHRMATLQAIQQEDNKGALETYSIALEKYGTERSAYMLARGQAQLLLKLGRHKEAQEVVLRYWPSFLKAHQYDFSAACRLLFDSMILQNNRDLAQKILEAAFVCNPRLFNDSATNQNNWMWDEIIGYYLARNETAKALSWAKLYFVTSSYSEEALAQAGRHLALIWSLTNPSASDAFLLAMDDPSKPNPLAEVPLPSMSPNQEGLPFECPSLEQLWEQIPAYERVSLLLWRGQPEDYARAVVEGMRVPSTKSIPNAGVLQVCRVLKAHDLRVARVGQYLHFLKTGQGDNPVDAILEAGKTALRQ